MVKTQKKASTKAVAFCSKLVGRDLPKSSSWESLSDIIMDEQYGPGFVWDMYTHCESRGNNTVVNIYKHPGEKTDLVETFSWPNELAYDDKAYDWEWPFLYKQIIEYLMKNWRTLAKGKKPKNKKAKTKTEPGQLINVQSLMKEVELLRARIKESSGTEKKRLIAEYNTKSKLLAEQMEHNGSVMDEKKAALQASTELYESLRRKKSNLAQRIRDWKAKGKDAAELEKDLAQVTKEFNKLPKPKKQ